ncbi:MAG: glycosyltransferase involved in cell wall biosynthesis [Planctomycetota bacterium]|jgi:glycosyltransferase involved in cell wall biosynthesis
MLATALALKEKAYRVTIVTSSGTRTRSIEQAGFVPRFFELPLDPWRQPFAALRTRNLLKKLKPSLLHATSDVLAPLLSAIAPSLRIPWIQELHCPATGPLLGNRSGFAAAIVNSEALIESVVNRGGIPRERVRTIKNAPTPLENTNQAKPFDHPGLPRIGCSGLLDNEHATAWFLEAARLMSLSGTRAMFFVFGEGPNEASLRRFIRDKGLNEHVTLAVPTTRSAAESLNALDIHVSCKLEGGPGWLACQALAQGVPSIFCAAGDAYALIEDKSNGILIEPNDSRRLADELISLSSNVENARQMGARGKSRLFETAPPSNFGSGIDAVYQESLASSPM